MYVSNGHNAYKNNTVNFASKEQLLLMLLDGAVKFAKISKQAIIDKDIKKSHENLVKTQDIFSELMITLDVEKSGEWGANLYQVYDFIVRRLRDANIKKSIEIVDEVIPLIEDIRDTWNEAYKLSKISK